MNRIIKVAALFIIVVVLFTFTGPIQGQTFEMPEEDVRVIETRSQIDIILVAVSTIVGVIAGGGGVLAVFSRLSRSEEVKDSTENALFNSIPLNGLEVLHKIFTSVAAGAQFGADVTDGEPNDTFVLKLPKNILDLSAEEVTQIIKDATVGYNGLETTTD